MCIFSQHQVTFNDSNFQMQLIPVTFRHAISPKISSHTSAISTKMSGHINAISLKESCYMQAISTKIPIINLPAAIYQSRTSHQVLKSLAVFIVFSDKDYWWWRRQAPKRQLCQLSSVIFNLILAARIKLPWHAIQCCTQKAYSTANQAGGLLKSFGKHPRTHKTTKSSDNCSLV